MNKPDNHLKTFISSQKLLTIATIDTYHKPQICNVYYSSNKDLRLFFVSSLDTNHGKHMEKNNSIAFSTTWYNEHDLTDRKSIQGTGICKPLTDEKTIRTLLRIHNKKYPLWKNVITYESMASGQISSKPYIITPTYMKFWNDILFGEEQAKEYEFKNNYEEFIKNI